jgi:hypothetical protein
MWRQHRWIPRFSPKTRVASTLSIVLAGSFAGGAAVEAAPIEATASDSGNTEPDRARDRAIAAARKAALEQALASIDTPTDADAVKQVLARADAWTASYRVLEVRTNAGVVDVRIEVEIDLPRLRKRVAVPSPSSGRSGFAWGALTLKDCPSVDEASIRQPLRAYGIVSADGPTTLSIAVTCSDRGAVSHTHVHAATVEIVAKTQGEIVSEVRFTTQGFAEVLDEATKIALDRAVAELGDELAVAARGELELRVEQPWPAARVTSLSNTLREAVLGVDAVALTGISADGSVILEVDGSIDAQSLARALQAGSFPGFRLIGLRIDGAHALRVRMQ